MPKKLRIVRKKTAQEPVAETPTTINTEEKKDVLLENYSIESIDERIEDLEESGSDDIDFDQEVKKLLGIRQASQAPQYFTKKQTTSSKDFVLENSQTITNSMVRVPSDTIMTSPVSSRASKVSSRC